MVNSIDSYAFIYIYTYVRIHRTIFLHWFISSMACFITLVTKAVWSYLSIPVSPNSTRTEHRKMPMQLITENSLDKDPLLLA